MEGKNLTQINKALILGLRDYFDKNNFDKAVIGLSGGLDSTVAAYVAVNSLGSKNVIGLLMPEIGVTANQSIEDAETVAKKLKIECNYIEINDFISNFKKINRRIKINEDPYATANTKARARMMLLYYFANIKNALVIGTSDKSEIALGYTTKFGDSASDMLVIGDLWKSDVVRLGSFLKIPNRILRKKPSAELIFGQTAEKELGTPYSILDRILKFYIEDDLSIEEIIGKGFSEKAVINAVKRIRLAEHKRRMPMLLRVSERSLHSLEWRMPITNKYRG